MKFRLKPSAVASAKDSIVIELDDDDLAELRRLLDGIDGKVRTAAPRPYVPLYERMGVGPPGHVTIPPRGTTTADLGDAPNVTLDRKTAATGEKETA